jgi:hypothetical protein
MEAVPYYGPSAFPLVVSLSLRRESMNHEVIGEMHSRQAQPLLESGAEIRVGVPPTKNRLPRPTAKGCRDFVPFNIESSLESMSDHE